jgi:hypothetical protein
VMTQWSVQVVSDWHQQNRDGTAGRDP